MTYSSTGTSGNGVLSIVNNTLQITNGSTAGRQYITGPLTTYSSPFNATLNSNSDTITWAFNAQYTSTTTPNGFGNGSFAMAVVLAGTNANLNGTSSNTGYAVVYGGSGFRNFRLVKFSSGLGNSGVITNVINTGANDLSTSDDVASVQVKFHPATRTWTLFSRDNNTAWTNPLSGTLTQRGVATIDSTYTGSAASVFGFFYNYGTTNQPGNIAKFEDFSVRVSSASASATLNAHPSTTLSFGYQWINTGSISKAFDVYGSGFTSNITVTAPTHFQVCTDTSNPANWVSSLNLTVTNGIIIPTTVYARFRPTSAGYKVGTITFSGGGGSGYPSINVNGYCNTTNTWINSLGGQWTVAANWSQNSVPLNGDSIRITAAGTYSIDSIPASPSYPNIIIGASTIVTFSSLGRASSISLTGTDSALIIRSGGTLILSPSGSTNLMEIKFATGSNGKAAIAGTLQCGANGLTTTNLGSYNATNSVTTVSGTLISENSGLITGSTTSLIFANGSNFTLNAGLTIPTATWQPGSNCNVFTRNTSGTLTGLAQTFHHFNVNVQFITSGQGIQCSGALTTINGNFHLQTTNWTSNDKRAFILASTQSYTLTIGGNLIIDNNAELELGSSSTAATNISLLGSLTINGTGHFYKNCTSCNTTGINFIGGNGVTQNFTSVSDGLTNWNKPGVGYTFNIGNSSNTNTVKLFSDFVTTNTSTINLTSGATLDCGTFIVKDSGVLNGGTFVMNSGGGLKMGDPNGITLSPAATGNIRTSSRTFPSTNGNFFYTGSVPQSTGNALPATVNDLTIQNSGGSTGVTLVNTVLVSNNLYLTNGKLTTGPDTVIMNNFSVNNGGINGGSISSYVNGYLTSSFRTGGYTRTIPIGDASAYTPIGITFTGITAQGKLTTHTVASDHPNISSSNFTPSRTVNRHWVLSNTGIVFGNYNATFNYVGADKDAGLIATSCYAGRYSGSTWTYPTMGTVGTLSAVVSGITAGFGDFQLGECISGTGVPDPDSAVASKSTICSGESINLTLWRGGISNIENVSWFTDSCNGTPIATGNNVSVSPTATTTYYGRFEGSASCSTPSNCRAVTITVNPSPLLSVFNPDAVCSAVSPTIDITQPSITNGSNLQGGALQYYTNLAATNTLSNPQAVGTSGTYYIKAVSPAGCSDIKSVLVTINPSPVLTITGSATSCSPSLPNLTQASLTNGSLLYGGNLTYFNDAATSSPVSNPSSVNAGTYYIKATTPQGCTDIEPVTAQVYSTPNLIINAPAPVCAAAPASFNLTQGSLTSGSSLTGATLLYYTDRNYSSAVSNPSAVGTGRYYLKAEITGAGCFDSDSVDITVREFGQWLGVNTNWNDAQNWCGGIPDASRDVTIPSGLSNYPVLSTGAAGLAKNISLASGGSLTVSGNTLKVYGGISGNRAINMTNGTLEMTGSTQQNFGGLPFTQARVRNLIISNPAGVVLSSAAADSLKIIRKLSFGNINNCQFNTGNNLTLISDSIWTASVADITNNGANSGNSITGNVTVERYVTQARKWQFLSIPTNTTQTFKQAWMEGANSITENPRPGYGTLITDNRSNWLALGFDALSPGGPSIKIYNPATGNYDAIASTSTTMNTQYGYMAYIRGDRTATPSNTTRNKTVLRTTGPLKQGVQPTINIQDSSFVSIGNPFASTIDMGKIYKPNCFNNFYIWDPVLAGSYGIGGYQTFAAFQDSTYYPIPGGGSYGANFEPYNQIQSGQAFFVRGGIGGSIQLKETDKMPDSTRQVMRPGRPPFGIIRPNLYSFSNNTPVLEDGVGIFFTEDFNNGLGREDAEKLRNAGINVAIAKYGKQYSIEGRRSLEENDTFRLNITGLRQTTYEWNVDMQNMRAPGRAAFLIDRFLSVRTRLNLEGNNLYRFSIQADPASAAADRFMIVFSQPAFVPIEISPFAGFRNEKRVDLVWKVNRENGIWNYDIERSGDDGTFKLLASNKQEATGTGISLYSFTDNDPLPGNNYYRIKARDAFGHSVYSEKILVEEISINEFVSVRPNPVTGKNIRLFFSKPQNGKYRVELLNNAGTNILSGEYSLSPGSRELIIPFSENLSSGTYFIHVSGIGSGSKSVQKLIIL